MKKKFVQLQKLPTADHLATRQISAFRQQLGYLFFAHLIVVIFLLLLTLQASTLIFCICWTGFFLFAWACAGFWCLRITEPIRVAKDPERAFRMVWIATLIWSSPWLFAIGFIIFKDATTQLLVLCVLIVLAAANSQAVGVHFPAAAISLFCILLPASLFFLTSKNRFDILLGFCLMAFFWLYLGMCLRFSRTFLENASFHVNSEHTIDRLKDQLQRQTSAREQAEKALCLAEQACLDKSRFLAAASHDLRQPMYAISLFVAALKSEAFESHARYLLDRLDRSLTGLDDLFNRLLDISCIDAGLITPTMKMLDALPIAQTLESRFMAVATSKSLKFRVRCKPDVQLLVDPELLIELLTNLLSNAFRYTERGGVLLSFRQRSGHVLIQVWDTGCGIPDDHRELIFDEFVQLNNPARDRRKGVGLGLAIVKRLADALGYAIEVRSQLGRGSCFGVRVESTPGIDTVLPEVVPVTGRRSEIDGTLVLVVDDEIDILAAMDAVLTSWGCFNILARSPEEAAKFVNSSPRFPDVIIADHRLENHQTSFDVIAAVAPLLPNELPVIVISGEANPSLKVEINAKGWQFMNKPVNATCLFAALKQALNKVKQSI